MPKRCFMVDAWHHLAPSATRRPLTDPIGDRTCSVLIAERSCVQARKPAAIAGSTQPGISRLPKRAWSERRSANADADARNADQAESRKPAGGRKMTLSPLGFSRSPWRPSPSSQRFARWASKTLGNHKKAASRTSPAIRRRQAPTNRLLGSMKPLWETTRVPIDHKSKVILE